MTATSPATWQVAQSDAAETLADELGRALVALETIHPALDAIEQQTVAAAISTLALVEKRQREKARVLLA